MASLKDSIHSPHTTLAFTERQGVESIFLVLKDIENRLRQNGHRTTFSEDGIYLVHGEAKSNVESTLKVEQLVRDFKKRMIDEIENDATKTVVRKPRLLACPTIASPSDWQECNISRHATDGLGWDVKTVVTASKREKVAPASQQLLEEEGRDGQHDLATHPLSPDASSIADGMGTRDATEWPPQEKPRVKLPSSPVETLSSEIDQTLCHVYSEPLTTDVDEIHQDRPLDPIGPNNHQIPHILIQEQQARIQELEEELKRANAARLVAENRAQELQEEAETREEISPARLNIEDLADEILVISTKNRVMERKHDRLAESFAQLQQDHEWLSRHLVRLDYSTARISQTISTIQDDRKTGVGSELLARMQTTVERHDSEWLPNLADRLSVMEVDLKALWAALHDYAPPGSASDTPTTGGKDPNDCKGCNGDALVKENQDGTFMPCRYWSSLA
ncbi:uncharacterized protein MYCFIDRAFT_175358 [Pseudocercospora fijiensis CIRAD86]|uniref:Uncharacterized protein n=1 Tax=Pseudocercospora fijiensis (strain CIRAD86) TaxID=383855 RepID=M2YVR9_PSEFD|nr:uncharacterized protein MYCFIDRAFT_175358 [Pseudocercospora fijiensis CIRAD86]EME81780.1 hypothetical protein MYCFIDRAFT_175358 [Pseudocercospora fijiensis CIRAD86]